MKPVPCPLPSLRTPPVLLSTSYLRDEWAPPAHTHGTCSPGALFSHLGSGREVNEGGFSPSFYPKSLSLKMPTGVPHAAAPWRRRTLVPALLTCTARRNQESVLTHSTWLCLCCFFFHGLSFKSRRRRPPNAETLRPRATQWLEGKRWSFCSLSVPLGRCAPPFVTAAGPWLQRSP